MLHLGSCNPSTGTQNLITFVYPDMEKTMSPLITEKEDSHDLCLTSSDSVSISVISQDG